MSDEHLIDEVVLPDHPIKCLHKISASIQCLIKARQQLLHNLCVVASLEKLWIVDVDKLQESGHVVFTLHHVGFRLSNTE